MSRQPTKAKHLIEPRPSQDDPLPVGRSSVKGSCPPIKSLLAPGAMPWKQA